MTDITATAPFKFPAVRAARLRSLLLGLGRGLCTLLQAYSEAIDLAHMAPLTGSAKQKGPAREAAVQGRDPTW